jgi:hypothetical protein
VSYNIDHVEPQVLEAWMQAKDVIALLKEHEGNLADINFLQTMEEEASKALVAGQGDRKISLPNIWWCGSWSGNGFNTFKNHIAPKIMGKVVAICTWEGGDSTSAFSIEDGVFEDCVVKMTVIKKGKT